MVCDRKREATGRDMSRGVECSQDVDGEIVAREMADSGYVLYH